MSERSRAFKAMSQALRRSPKGRKRGHGSPANGLTSETATLSTEAFLGAYRELSAVSARLQERLGAEDPLNQEIQEALAQARAAWNGLLTDGDHRSPPMTPGTHGSHSPAPSPPAEALRAAQETMANATESQVPEPSAAASDVSESPRHSLELVPTGSSELTVPRVRPRYPDEAALVRYFRERRERRRLPDEAVISRYLRERRERGPRYPDEAALARYFRERREGR